MHEEPTTPRFVWPPRQTPAREHSPRSQVEPQPSPPYTQPHPSVHATRPSAAGAGTSVLSSIESTWLNLTTPPLHSRLSQWSPDKPSDYCPRCGTTCGPFESSADGCPTCSSRKLPWERLIRLSEYRGTIRDMIHEVKFTRWRKLGDQLGQLLGASISTEITHAGLPISDFTLIPIPSSFLRRISRGIDHAVVIARGVSRSTGIPLVHALSRSHRPSQVSIPASSRAANVAGSIRAKRFVRCHTPYILLLDDVTTTRATLTAGCKALLSAHKSLSNLNQGHLPRVWTAVVAVTPRPNTNQPNRSA